MESQNCTGSPRRVVGFALLLTLIVAIAYGNSFSGQFVLDDAKFLQLEQAPDLADFSGRIAAVAAGGIRSVGNLSFTLNYLLIGDAPEAFHVGNFVVHLATALVLFELLRRLFQAPYFENRYAGVATELAFVVALIWAVHPLATMGVTYLIQRFESQAALFYLLTLYCVTRCCLTDDWRWGAASIVTCGLAIGTKEVAISAPLIAVALDRSVFASSWRQLLRKRGWAYGGMLLVTAYVAFHLRSAFEAGAAHHLSVAGLDHVTWWEYLRTESQVITHYVRLALFPYPLCFDYEWPIARNWNEYAASGLFVVGLLAGTCYALCRWPPIGVAGLLFFGLLAPSSSFVPIADPAFEYRMYLPLASIVLLVVVGGFEIWRRWETADGGLRRYLPVAAVTLITMTFVGMTLERNRVYRSAETVWRSVVELRPDHVRANHNLTKILKDEGRLDEAAALLENSRRQVEDDPAAAAALEIELGELAVGQGRITASADHFRQAIERLSSLPAPSSETLRRNAEAHIGLGALLQQQGDHAAAAEMLVAATKLRPGLYPQAHGMAGVSLREQGKLDEAERQLDQAVSLTGPNQPWRRERALVYFEQGELKQAADQFAQWRQNHPADLEITLRLAWLRAAAAPAEVRDLGEAKRLTESLVAQLGPQQQLLDLVAIILAAEGNYAEATRLCKSAIDLQRRSGGDLTPIESRLQLFENRRPFRSAKPSELF